MILCRAVGTECFGGRSASSCHGRHAGKVRSCICCVTATDTKRFSFVLVVFNLGCCSQKEYKLLAMLASESVLIVTNAAGRLTQAARQKQRGVGRRFSPAWLKSCPMIAGECTLTLHLVWMICWLAGSPALNCGCTNRASLLCALRPKPQNANHLTESPLTQSHHG